MSRFVKFLVEEIDSVPVMEGFRTFDIKYISSCVYKNTVQTTLFYYDVDQKTEINYTVKNGIFDTLSNLRAGFVFVTSTEYLPELTETPMLLNSLQIKDITEGNDFTRIYYFKDYTLYDTTMIKVIDSYLDVVDRFTESKIPIENVDVNTAEDNIEIAQQDILLRMTHPQVMRRINFT